MGVGILSTFLSELDMDLKCFYSIVLFDYIIVFISF